MARRIALAVCALALAGCAGGDSETTPPSWNHDPDDMALGPAAWDEIDESFERCLSGRSQSPVDIAGAVPAGLPELVHDYPPTTLTVENTGHTIEVSLPESSNLTLTIDDAEYRLLQFHFHAPSEHTLDGRSYDGEVHLVHESEDGELAVVATFLERSELVLTLVPEVLESAPDEVGEEVELDRERSPLELLQVVDADSAVGYDYDTYSGSLTTPGCTEGVRWIVLPGALPTSPASIDRLHELIAGFPAYDGYENNNRPAQPLNGREIQRTRG